MQRFSVEGGSGGTPAGSAGPGMLGLDMALHHHQIHEDQLLPSHAKSHDADHHRPQQQRISHTYGGSGRGKQLSPEDEPRFGEEGIGAAADGSKPASPSPWHRMKWTDSMVRLLIMVVYYIGDDGATEGDQHPPQPAAAAAAAVGKGKKATTAGGLQQQQQKKGKWKSVSRAMMEKGYHVSPQQCEDKFNDLNKRYKRVKELLGKGTACRVVEDHALLDSMPHLAPKAKDEARRLLNSKHLFFREMCAYHTAGGGGAANSPSAASPPQPPPQKEQYQCFHHPSEAAAMCRGVAASLVRGAGGRIAEDDENDEAGSEDGDDDDDEGYDDDDGEEEDDNSDEDEGGDDEDFKGLMAPTTTATATATSTSSGAKRPRGRASTQPKSAASPPLSLSLWSPPPPSTSMQQLRSELTGLSGRGEQQHQWQWLRRRAAELGEQQMGYRGQALQLERQRFKWIQFSSNKEREMERTKLKNERLRLQNERMLLLLHQKELELISNEGGGAASSHAVPPTADRQTTN